MNRVTYARGEGVDRGTISIKERGGEEPGLKRAVERWGKVKRRGGRVNAQYSNMRNNFIDRQRPRHQDTSLTETRYARSDYFMNSNIDFQSICMETILFCSIEVINFSSHLSFFLVNFINQNLAFIYM